jgi:hypothetical protein
MMIDDYDDDYDNDYHDDVDDDVEENEGIEDTKRRYK